MAFLALLPPLTARADDSREIADVPLMMPNVAAAQTPLATADRNHSLGLLFDYVRTESPAWLPGLPAALRAPLGWATSGLGAARDEIDDDTSGLMPSFLAPLGALMQAPGSREAEALWLTPGYHHKGFMPFEDAVTMGFNYRDAFFGDRAKLSLHPFYGQNWLSPQGFWGTEVALGIGPDATRSWGKIIMRYESGARDLMGNNERGFEMGTELAFADHFSLDAGVRQDNETDLGNYVMLRWRLADFGE